MPRGDTATALLNGDLEPRYEQPRRACGTWRDLAKQNWGWANMGV